jgi:Ca2+-binding EF-hand superfamily protein
MGATGGLGGTMGGAMAASNGLDQIGEEGDRLPEGFTPDGVISLETFIDMRNIWSVFDLDETNRVSVAELRTILRALDLDPSADELHAVRKQIDPSGLGYFTFEKLKEVMEEKLRDVDTPQDLLEQLHKLDKDKDGKIPNPEFKQFIMNLGQKMTLEEAEELMAMADPRGDGTVDLDELSQALCPPKK